MLILVGGNLMGSLVGQSEERTRQALRAIDAMAQCVVMIDDVEKAFSGGSGSGDSACRHACSVRFCHDTMIMNQSCS